MLKKTGSYITKFNDPLCYDMWDLVNGEHLRRIDAIEANCRMLDDVINSFFEENLMINREEKISSYMSDDEFNYHRLANSKIDSIQLRKCSLKNKITED